MIADNRQIQQLLALLLGHGITDVVVCPGSRNAPLVHSLGQVKGFACHPMTDERSAGFVALGMAQATHRPVAVCVTSGSALVNLHPAVTEAYYQQIPLIVISADRPKAWIGQMDGQTMPQEGVFGKMVRMSVSLPEIHTDTDEWHCNRLINEALLECRHHVDGPVHINVPVSEPLYEFHTEALPKVRRIKRVDGRRREAMEQLFEKMNEKCLIIIGQNAHSIDENTLPTIHEYAAILGESLSNLHLPNIVVGNLDTICKHIIDKHDERFTPEVVITLGGHVVSKQLKLFLRSVKPQQHWHVDAEGKVVDLFQCLTHVVEMKTTDFIEELANYIRREGLYSIYPEMWENEMRMKRNGTLSEVEEVVGELIANLPEDSVVHLANSSAVRYAQKMPFHRTIRVCCNRGINGIEGSMSTAVGYAMACPQKENYLIIGDLSFFYDQNALWNTHLPANLHILLLNSGGGRIFDTLPVPNDKETREMVCALHHTSARHACEQYGITYLTDVCIETFIHTQGPTLLEIQQ